MTQFNLEMSLLFKAPKGSQMSCQTSYSDNQAIIAQPMVARANPIFYSVQLSLVFLFGANVLI